MTARNMSQAKTQDYLTTGETAALLRVGKGKVLHWIHTGRLSATNVGLGSHLPQYRVARDDVRALCNRLRHRPSAS